MDRLQHPLTLLAGAAVALPAGFLMSTAFAHADAGGWPAGGPYETCDGAVCLVMGDANPNDWAYDGFRPFFTQWKQEDGQQYDVMVNQGDGTPIDAGSYDIKVSDTWSPLAASYVYQYGDFHPNADAPSGLDLGWFGDLSGATVYNTQIGDKASLLTINHVGPHDVSYIVTKYGDFTNTMIVGDNANADYIQVGDNAPSFLWNTLFHSGFTDLQVPHYFIPADPFAGPDFNPGDYDFGNLDLADLGLGGVAP